MELGGMTDYSPFQTYGDYVLFRIENIAKNNIEIDEERRKLLSYYYSALLKIQTFFQNHDTSKHGFLPTDVKKTNVELIGLIPYFLKSKEL